MTDAVVARRLSLFKASFFEVMGKDKNGNPTPVGRWSVFVTAPTSNDVGGVIKAFLPELYEEGFDLEEVVVPVGHMAWSVSIGPEGRSYSLLITGPAPEHAEKALIEATKEMEYMARYVRMRLWTARLVDLSREGVW